MLKVIDYWQKVAGETVVLPRMATEKIDLKSRKIIDVTGVRRSGKSFILRALWQKVSKNNNALYLNFEDPYFEADFPPSNLEKTIEIFREYYSHDLKYIFWDEVQRIAGWERVVRKYEEAGKMKFVVSGSSAKLLKGEMATLLTGRHESIIVFPLSFSEYLRFNNIRVENKKDLVLKGMTLHKEFKRYLVSGGFPETVITGKMEYVKNYFGDILEKDIFARHDVRDKMALRKMAVFLLSNCGNQVSQRSLGRLYGLSFPAVDNFLDYFSESFLLFFVPRFSYSLKQSQLASRKIYAVDTGLAGVVSYGFSADWGLMLENAVYLELIRRGEEVYYYKTKSGGEVDFILRKKDKPVPVQVCWDLAVPKTLDREIKALKEAQRELNSREGYILTAGNKEEKIENIQILPVIKWLLSG